MGKVEIRTEFRLGNLKGRVHLEDEGEDGRIILKRESCAVLGYYVASYGNFLSTFRSDLQGWAVLKKVTSRFVL